MTNLNPEVRPIFAAECEEHLTQLTEGFLALEKEPDSMEHLDRMFRTVHSLKGTCRVMGCMDLARALHALEDLLERLRAGPAHLNASQFNELSRVMNQFWALMTATLEGGGDSASLADALVESLSQCMPGPAGEEPPASKAAPDLHRASTLAGPPAGKSQDVIRVPTARLDSLMAQMGELLGLHQRMIEYVQRCAELRDTLDEASRDRRLSSSRNGAQQWAAKAENLVQDMEKDEGRMGKVFKSLEMAIVRTRMVPLSQLFGQIPKWVRDLSQTVGRPVDLVLKGTELEIDKGVLEGLRDPLLHLVRNALDHGIENPDRRAAAGKLPRGQLSIAAIPDRGGISLTIADDGAGLDLELIRRTAVARGWAEAEAWDEEALRRVLFQPGFSTRTDVSEISGRGVGLDAVADQIAALKGQVSIRGESGRGCTVSIWVPLNLTSARVLRLESAGLHLGLPSVSVAACLKEASHLVKNLEGRPAVIHAGHPVMLMPLWQLVGWSEGKAQREPGYIVIAEWGGTHVALGVDDIAGELEVLQQPLPKRIQHLHAFHGLSILGNGQILLLLDPAHLFEQARSVRMKPVLASPSSAIAAEPKSILLADDSLTTRVQLRRILESEGYRVQPAVDGLDAWSRLASQAFDAVVSDVQMPGLDGLALTERIRSTRGLAELPVVLVTTLGQAEEERRGMAAGASAYLIKSNFDQDVLLGCLRRLLP